LDAIAQELGKPTAASPAAESRGAAAPSLSNSSAGDATLAAGLVERIESLERRQRELEEELTALERQQDEFENAASTAATPATT
jgi:hypothetical protein